MWGKGLLVAGCVLAALAGQESAPESRAARPPIEYRLDCGLRVRLVPVRVPGEIAVILGVHGAGVLAEPRAKPHLAHVSEHGIFFSDGEGPLAAVERWFADTRANAETLPEIVYFDLYPHPAEIAAAIAIQHRRFTAGTAVPAVLEREKPKALAEATTLERLRSKKQDLLGKFAWTAFGQVATFDATDVTIRETTLAFTPEDVTKFRRRNFAPERAMLTVVGDFDPDAVSRTIPENWTPADRMAAESRPLPRAGVRAGSWDLASHQLFMAWPAPAPSDAAHPALAIAAQTLTPRLLMNAAMNAAAIQPVGVFADTAGLFVVQAPLENRDGGAAAQDAIVAALARISDDGSALSGMRGLRASVRTAAGVGRVSYPPQLVRKILAHANAELSRMRATLTWDQPPEDYCARLDAVTADDVRAAIKTWLAPEKATVVTIAGPE